MSIRFPSDDNAGMSAPNAARKRGGGGVFFLMILGVIAFMIMRGVSSSGPAGPEESNPNPTDRRGVSQYPDLQRDQPAQRADQGDWGMEDGPVQRNASSKKASSGSINTNKSSNGDWGMEGVTSTKKQQPAGRFSQPSNGRVTTPKKPAAQGDWSLDTDVESARKPAVLKKTIQGDWGLEQVE